MTDEQKVTCPICGLRTGALPRHIRDPGGHDWDEFERECL